MTRFPSFPGGGLLAVAPLFVLTIAGRAADAPAVPAEVEGLLEAGRQLWDEYAPPEVKEHYEFPTIESVREFLAALEADLEEGTVERLAAYEFDARRALGLLRRFEGGDDLADWLQPRVDLLTAANELMLEGAPAAPAPEAGPRRAAPAAGRRPYTRPYWHAVVIKHPPPERAKEFVPQLKRIFTAEGVAPQWVWIAEVESSMNPRATSPAGARGLFQFMPATAERFGLSTSWPDERTDPAKSARAAAAYLRFLYQRFQSWPLAVAAYNAGEGRIGRLLASGPNKTFAGIADRLPPETRMYVPKVLATVAARESVDPESLPAPRVAGTPAVPSHDAVMADVRITD